ncbi:hypothetical protein [Litorimonas sp.]|uniref:hypothetical protein n=1 Tax=Litorimonas sp. TaxID=1892381 RepID=UPI003A8811F2
MSFRTVQINQVIKRSEDEVARFRQGYIEPKRRSMSDRRLLATVVALFVGLCLSYSSLFYLPSMLSNRSVLAVSTQDKTLPKIDYEKNRTVFSPFFDLFHVQRGYFRAGQMLQVDYNIPAGYSAVLNIKSCKGFFLLEALNCEPVLISSREVAGPKRGISRFKAPENGFYIYETQVAEDAGKELPYSVMWRRVPAS